MHIQDIGIFVVLIVSVVLSIARKLAEQARARRSEAESRRVGAGVPRPKKDLGDIPTAQRRPAQREASNTSVEDMVRRLVQTATGEESGEGVNDEGWQPVAPPPPIRRQAAAPTQYQKPPASRPAAPPQRAAPTQPQRRMPEQAPRPAPPRSASRPPGRPVAVPPPRTATQRPARVAEEILPIEIEQRENERRWREEMERKKKQQHPARQPETVHSRARLMPARRRLFHNASEVRRAIILSEVLLPPRAMRDFEDRV